MAVLQICLRLAVALSLVNSVASAATSSMTSSLIARDAAMTLKERPVMKVIRLLQDMGAELQQGLDDDNEVHAKLDCWCKNNDKEKNAAIENGQANIQNLKASMDDSTAKILELKARRKATMQELDDNHRSLGQAEELRLKENKKFHGEEADTIEAVRATKQAIVVLSEHNALPSQLQTVARRLQQARVLAQLPASSSLVGRHQLDTLKSFLNPEGAKSFLSQPAGYQSHSSQSGQIFGILKQMLADFEASLSDAQKAEIKAQEEFDALRAAKRDEIKRAQEQVVQIDSDLAKFGEKHAQAAQELEDAQNQLENDQAFLADLTKKCAESQTEYDNRVKSRQEEIVAVQDTIKILNDDEAFANFDKTVNSFLQTASVEEEPAVRARAVKVLRTAAGRAGLPELALLAAQAQLNDFKVVKEKIDGLVAELAKQQKDEVDKRDWCINEHHGNSKSTEANQDAKAKLTANKADLEKSIKSLTDSINAAQADVRSIQEEMKRASETREAEHADFSQTISDQRMTQAILNKALNRMREVYAFLQQQPGAPHIATSGTHTDAGNAPVRFTKYEQHAGGKKVLNMLETVIADSRKVEDEAITSESDSQSGYVAMMQESNSAITQRSKEIAGLSGSRAKAEVSLSQTDSDLKTNAADLANDAAMLADIKDSCDFTMKNFDARQAARSAEMESLKEAKAILSGMN